MPNIDNPNTVAGSNPNKNYVKRNGLIYIKVADSTEWTIAAGAVSVNFINIGDGAGGGSDADIILSNADDTGYLPAVPLPANQFSLNPPMTTGTYNSFKYNANGNQLFICVVY